MNRLPKIKNNPPENPKFGDIFYNIKICRLQIYIEGGWHELNGEVTEKLLDQRAKRLERKKKLQQIYEKQHN